MATRLYFDTNAASLTSYPASSAVWDLVATTPQRRPLERARYGANTTLTAAQSETTATSPYDVLLGLFVSKPLSGDQTITGTFKGMVSATESNAGADMVIQTVIRVFSGDMTTERGVLYGGNSVTTVTNNGEFGTSATTRSLIPQVASGSPTDTAVSSVSALSGDVIVVEVGYRALNTVTTSYSGTLTILTGGNPTSNPDATSLAQSSGFTTWIEFSQDLVFTGDYAFGDADDIDVPFDLTGTMTTPVGLSLAGSIDVDVDATLTTNFLDRKIGRDEFKAAVVASAPYFYWPMTEGSGATILDASGNGRDGTITGGAWSTALTGSPYGDTGYNFAAAATGNITWTGTVPAASTANGFTIMFVYQQSANNLLLNSTASNGDPWYISDGTTAYFYCSGTTTGDRFVFTKQPSTTYRCIIIRVTKTNGNTALTSEQFMLGQQVAAAGVAGLTNNGTRFQIGKGSTTGSATFQQIAYWDRPLTTNEIDAFSNAFLIEPTPQAIAGTADLDVGLEGTLSLAHPLVGEIDLDVDLSATNSTLYPLSGEVTEDVDLTGTATFTVLLDGTLDVDVSLDGDLSVGTEIFPLAIAGEIDVDVSLEGDLFVPTQLLLAGTIDLDFDLYADSFEESFRAGTLDIPFDLTATLTSALTAPTTFSTLTLSTLTGAANVETILVPLTLTVETDTYIFAKVRSPLVIPPAPEPALPGEIPVASGVLLRALHGVIVDMATPAIEDGQPS